jgi:hypothetical protein
MKTCTKCGLEKELTSFPKHPNGRDGRNSWCQACANALSLAWYHALTPEQKFRRNLRGKAVAYGLDPDIIEAHWNTHNGVCDICQQPPSGSRRLSIEHDHTTGKFRGITCDSCNNGLARFKDDVKLLEAAINYLIRARDSEEVT